MKYLLGTLLLGSLIFSCTSNDAATTSKTDDSTTRIKNLNAASDSANFTQIQWVDSIHQQLGSVKEGSVVEVSWKFKNTGSKPLIVSNVNASCGCTVAEKPEAPIAPGAEGVIRAKFDSKDRMGTQRKDVYVLTNTGKEPQQLSFAVAVEK
ncbi:MAG: DUF1573 domain-containing protein [Chitinophagaceae bacterium]